MGEAKQKKSRKVRFAETHPACCYCGGSRPTESVDHVPPTIFFRDKYRPNLYELPACLACHKPFSKFDTFFALIAKSADNSEFDRVDVGELRLLAQNSHRHFGRGVEHIAKSFRDIWVPIKGIFAKRVSFNLNHWDVYDCMYFMSARIAIGLYYHITKTIVPHQTAITTFWATDEDFKSGKYDSSMIARLSEYGAPQVGTLDFSDQFEFRYTLSQDNRSFTCMMRFNKALIATAFFTCSDLAEKQRVSPDFVVTADGFRKVGRRWDVAKRQEDGDTHTARQEPTA